MGAGIIDTNNTEDTVGLALTASISESTGVDLALSGITNPDKTLGLLTQNNLFAFEKTGAST